MRAMAYQSMNTNASYASPPIANPGSGPAQFHPSPSPSHQAQQQQLHLNAYPSHVQLAQRPEGQMNNGPGHHNPPNQISGIGGGGGGGGAAAATITNVPNDPFKKPYLPPKHGRLALPFGD